MSLIDKVDAICATFYDVGTQLANWKPVLNRLSRTLGGQGCDLYLLRHRAPVFSFIGGQPDEVAQEYVEHYIHREPRSQFLMCARQGRVATDLDFVSADFMRTSDYYADFLARGNMRHCVAAVPIQTRDKAAYFGFHLPRDAGPPDASLMRLIVHIQPHLNRAIHSQFHLIDAQLHGAMYSEAFDRLNIGIVIVGNAQKILVANKLAEAMLREGTVLGTCNRCLAATRGEEAGTLSAMIAGTISGDRRAGGSTLLHGTGAAPVSVTVTPTASEFRERTGAAAIVFLVRCDDLRARDLSAALRDLYGLTRTEARIASLLANGRSIREIGDELELAYETVRSVVKSVFAKTGVRRQGELVARVNAAIPPLIPHPADPV